MSAHQLDDIQIGTKFGTAIVTGLHRGGKDRMASCRCDCGKTFATTLTRIRRKHALSCPSCASKKAWQDVRRLSPDELMLRRKERGYHRDAKRKGREWDLDRAKFRELIDAPCNYCGIEQSDGIDRRDNSIGYTIENSVPCCEQCNYAKRNQTAEGFLAWVSRIAKFQDLKS